METLKTIGIIVAIAAILFLSVAAVAPRTYYVERKLVIHSSPEMIYSQVNDFKKWDSWSPWVLRDSSIENVFSGPNEGVGNKVTWTSKKSSAGTLEITECHPARSITIMVDILPLSELKRRFTFNKVDGGTEVTWSDSGNINYPKNIFNLVANKVMGKDFERGLANLKLHVEMLPDTTQVR